MNRALIIAVGNVVRGDDGWGPRVAERLADGSVAKVADILICHQFTPEMAEAVSRASRVIFLDARQGSPAGALTCELVTPRASWSALTHHLDPAGLLALAQEVYGHAPEAFAISVAGHDFGHGHGLTGRVRDAVPDAVWCVDRLVHRAARHAAVHSLETADG